MPDDQSPEAVINGSQGHVLVLGGPGSGKTTLALNKAIAVAQSGLAPGQSVLFLSFSRAAIARLSQASASQVPAHQRDQISLQTFHSFCWSVLKSHGYLLGSPFELKVLLPHDERSLSAGAERDTPEWTAWEAERERLFMETGQTAFDLFAPKVLDLLNRSPAVRRLVVQQFPVIIVDEAQDTGQDAWALISALKDHCQIICLGDLEQQIVDYLPGVGPERIEAIRRELTPVEINLGSRNNRSPGTEIVEFANDVLSNRARGAPYDGVTRLSYDPRKDLNLTLRRSIAVTAQNIKDRTNERPESIAILVRSGRDAAIVSAALSKPPKSVPHKVVFDEAKALLASRFAAFLLEPKQREDITSDLCTCLDFLAAVERAAGSKGGKKNSDKYRKWSLDRANGGRIPNNTVIPALEAMLADLASSTLTGDPRADWLAIKGKIRDCPCGAISSLASQLDYLVAFGRGQLLASSLSSLWTNYGSYRGARSAFDVAMAQDAILEAAQDLTGIHVMTVHKSKAKQFDGVIVMRTGVRQPDKQWGSSFVWRDDPPPYPKSRKVLRVAITRARRYVLMLEPLFPECPIMDAHQL